MYRLFSKMSLVGMISLCIPLTGCIDDNYDLSDVDTSAELKVKDLVVPVNLDEITLSNIFDLDKGSVVKEIDNQYAVLVDGNFQSPELKIGAVTLGRPEIPSKTTDISLTDAGGNIVLPPVNIEEQILTYEVPEFKTSFSYTTSDVDKSIRSLSKIAVRWSIDINLTVRNADNIFKSVAFRNVSLLIPAGLHTTNLVNDNGRIKLPDINLGSNNMTYTVTLDIDEIDFSRLTSKEFTFTTDASGDKNGSLSITGTLGVEGGYVVAVTNSNITNIPAHTTLTLAPAGSGIAVSAIDGNILYRVDDFNVDPVELKDLPDLLHQKETNITIANPRLFISINNPMADYRLEGGSGLTLTACRENGSRDPYSLDPGEEINIGYDHGIAGPYNFCLAPDPTNAGAMEGYENPAPVRYKGLSNVLSGNGLPTSIEVSFDRPHVGPGDVIGFAVPQTLDKISGTYKFYAPLELGLDSRIVYDKVTDGWNDETVDKITIEKLKVTASVTNSLPFDIVLTGYPIDPKGNQCRDANGNPVTLSEVIVSAGATSPLLLESSGTITHLDGIHYYATAVVSKAGVTLRPDATITISGIKATISGHYIDKL